MDRGIGNHSAGGIGHGAAHRAGIAALRLSAEHRKK
jgi:hypothetical protein